MLAKRHGMRTTLSICGAVGAAGIWYNISVDLHMAENRTRCVLFAVAALKNVLRSEGFTENGPFFSK